MHRGPSSVPGGIPTDAMWAAGGDDIQLLRTRLGDPSVLEEVDREGWTVLHHAAAYGTVENVELCLYRGADPTARSRCDETPLIVAGLGADTAVQNLLRSPGHGRDRVNDRTVDPLAVVGNTGHRTKLPPGVSSNVVVVMGRKQQRLVCGRDALWVCGRWKVLLEIPLALVSNVRYANAVGSVWEDTEIFVPQITDLAFTVDGEPKDQIVPLSEYPGLAVLRQLASIARVRSLPLGPGLRQDLLNPRHPA